MALSDREKWILGVIGSIATLGIGYLIWRHESAITQAQNQQNTAAQAANDQAYAQELEQALQVGGGQASQLGGGGGYIGASTTSGATIDPTGGTGGDSNLAAILAAFFPQGTDGTTNNGSVSGGTSSENAPNPVSPSTGMQAPTANPVSEAPIDVSAPFEPTSAPVAVPVGIRPVADPAKPIQSHNLVNLGSQLVQ